MSFPPGSRLGVYQLLGNLGAGGMGEVYRAHDPRLGRDVALKVLPAEMASDPARLERFTREARAIAALNHPHIVTIYSTEEADGIRFLTMEVVEGQALDTLIPPAGLPIARFFDLAMPLADALTAAHQKQITHRDLKPANVMVAQDGRVKVLDFGLAKTGATGAPGATRETMPQLTAEGSIIGTMPYMSPEQIEGKALDHRTDLFSLGVMFHEMLVGTRPFTGDSSPQLMSSILRDTPASATDVRPDIPEALSRLIHRCLEKRPEDRVQTARDVYNELRHVQKQIESGPVRRPDSGVAARLAESLWIAVLPFTTRGTDSDAVTLAAGLTEDITAGLARFEGLSLIAPQSASSFKDAALDVRQIGERLGARFIIGGSVRRAASGIRVAAHLTDAQNGAQLWTDTYDRDANTDLYAVLDDVTDRVVATLADVAGVLARSLARATQGIPVDRLSARQLIHRCWGFNQRMSAAEHAELRGAVEAAISREPENADLLAELSMLYVAEHALLMNPQEDPLGRASRAARAAIEINSSHQVGWVGLAVSSYFGRDESGFLEAADRVMKLNPRNTYAVTWAGALLSHKGEYDRGSAIVERCMALNPSHSGTYHFTPFNGHFARGEYKEALKAARRVNVADFMWMHLAIAAAAGHLGLAVDGKAAVAAFERLVPPLADPNTLREFVSRWYWDEEFVDRLLDGVWRSKGSQAPAQTGTHGARARAPEPPTDQALRPAPVAPPHSSSARASIEGASATPVPSGQSTMLERAASAGGAAIAVQLFASRGGEKATAFAAALTDDITTGLSRFSHLRVVSHRPEGTPASARFVLEGSVRRETSVLRVSARVIDTSSGAHLWAETYDQPTASDIRTRVRDRMRARGIVSDSKAPGVPPDDIAAHIIATVADVYGVLFRAMSQGLKERSLETLSAGDVLLRYWSYERQPEVAEHALLRTRLEQLVDTQPHLADAWAALGDLYYQEFAHGFNPLPDSLARAHQAVRRALDLDAVHHHAWHVRAVTCYFDRDRDGFEHAAERALALNPHDTNTTAFLAFLWSQLGETDRACEMTARAMALNPAYPGWYHFVFFDRHYMRGEFADALAQARKINMAQNLWSPWAVAVSAGQLARATDARAALDALLTLAPAFKEESVLREAIVRWRWNQPANVELAMDGFRKAKALTASDVAAPDLAAKAPARTPDSAAGLAADAFVVTVIPFAAAAGGDAAELADGLTQGTAVGLSRFSYLRAVTRNVTADSITTGYVLTGSVRMAGGVVRVVVQLTAAATGQNLWAETYDRRSGAVSLFDMQDEIAEKIVATIADVNGALVRAISAVVRHRPAESLTPYEAVLRALAYIALMSPEEHAALTRALELAVERAPTYADAWAALAFIYSEELAQSFNERPGTLERVRSAVRRALELDPSNQLAYFAQCRVGYFTRDMSMFRAAADRVIAINPLATHALSFVGTAKAYAGDWEGGLALVERAMALNPHHAGIYHMPYVMDRYRRRDYAGALEILDRVNMPGYPNVMLARAAVYAQLGRLDEAAAVWREADARVPGYGARLHAELTKWFSPDHVAHIQEAVAKILRHSSAKPNPRTPEPPNPGTSIAVLPFTDLSAEKNQDWFCDGVAEEILNALTALPGLRVAARASAFSFRNRPDDLAGIASKLGVATVLQGSVRRAGDRVRVTVQLVDATNGFQLWSERYDRQLEDIFDVQDEIARAVADRLKVTLALGAGERLVAKVTGNIEAYELLLKGRTFLTRRGRAILDALSCFEQATALDQNLAEAHALLGDAYRLTAVYGIAPAADVIPKARAALDRALAIDPRQVEALATLANIATIYDWDVATSQRLSDRALEIDPNHVRALGERSIALAAIAAPDPAMQDQIIASARRARALDPLNAWAAALEGIDCALLGRHAEATIIAEQALVLDPDNFTAHWTQVIALGGSQRYEEALAAAEPALAMSGRSPRILIEMAAVHAARGDRSAADLIYQELRTRAQASYIGHAELAAAAASAGRLDEARRLVAQAIELRDTGLTFWKLPSWAPLRADAASMALLRATSLLGGQGS